MKRTFTVALLAAAILFGLQWYRYDKRQDLRRTIAKGTAMLTAVLREAA